MDIRKILAALLLLMFSFELYGGNASYPRLLVPGDYADPTILRDGNDYYMTHSSFFYSPGLLIWHSTDLINWEPLSRAYPGFEDSIWAPEIVKIGEKFYIYFPTSKGEIYVIYTDDIKKGEWSKPIKLDIEGIDPGHLVDVEGKRYIYTNNGWMAPLSDDGLYVIGPRVKVYDGWKYPESWITEGDDMYLESPKLFSHNGYYYMVSAEGGTAGPATSHMCVVARAKSPYGPWEDSPYNPVVHTYSSRDNWWSKGHGTLIDDVDGNWWMVYHAYAKGYHTLGRQTLIEPMEYTADGWFRPRMEKSPAPQTDGKALGFDLNDDFRMSDMNIQWSFWKEYAPDAVSVGNGRLMVDAKGTTPADGRLLMLTAQDKNYEITVDVAPDTKSNGGLILFYNENAYVGVTLDRNYFYLYLNPTIAPDIKSLAKGIDVKKIKNTVGNTVKIKLSNRCNNVDISVSVDGREWTILAENIDVGKIHHNNLKQFLALRPALVAMGKGKTRFEKFWYKSGVPSEQDMSAYLMVYHKDDTHSLHMAISRDGYTFTALNNDSPVMAGDTIATQKGIRDPHIFRGPDGAFYVSATDLHIFAKQAGYRATQWERDDKYGWGNNRGLVLLKSYDLINWKRTNVLFDEIYKGMSDVGCVWAPELTFDEESERLMLHFTMRYGNGPNRLYYVYVNEAFDMLEGEPQLLFSYPDENVTAIDGDITKVGDKYHLFYVAHDGTGGIKQAVSDCINSGYVFDPRWYDLEPKACEAPNVWKRIGENKWVLMYDVFSVKPHNFGFVETSDFVNFKDLGRFNEGVMRTTNFSSPKHGAVVQITEAEADKLEQHWNTTSVVD